jgi:hypothetical protein
MQNGQVWQHGVSELHLPDIDNLVQLDAAQL